MNPRILFLVASDYDDLLKKGVAGDTQQREENGFFERVITVHPWARSTRTLDLTPVHRLYEIQEVYPAGWQPYKALRYIHHLLHAVRVVRQVIRWIDEEKINLLRATDPAYTGFLGWIITRLRPVPLIVSVHADYDTRYRLDGSRGAPTLFGSRSLARFLELMVMRSADRVMPIRESLANKFIAHGVPSKLIRTIPHGINLADFQHSPTGTIRAQLALDPHAQIISFAGRLSRENYIYDIAKLALELKKRRPNFALIIAGDGPERQNLERFFVDNHLRDVAGVIGFQPRDGVIELRMESALSLCLMGGFSLIEACAAGRPVVAYDVEWHSELVKTGETGWLVPERNIEGLCNAVIHSLDNPEEATRMGAAARALAFERHDFEKVSALRRQYYQELLPTA